MNNVSSAYSKLGQCDKAKAAAEKALSIRKFSAAELNKNLEKKVGERTAELEEKTLLLIKAREELARAAGRLPNPPLRQRPEKPSIGQPV